MIILTIFAVQMIVKIRIMGTTFEFEVDKDRPLYSLSCREFIALARYIRDAAEENTNLSSEQAIGISALAAALNCSPSQISNMRRDGVLDMAIISRFGRNIVFDVKMAREAANRWYDDKKKKEE